MLLIESCRAFCHGCQLVWTCAESSQCCRVQTSTYTFRDTEELIAYQEGRYGSYEYGRYGNPTTRAVEEKIRVRSDHDRGALQSSAAVCIWRSA